MKKEDLDQLRILENDTSAIDEEGRHSQGDTPIPVIIRPMRSMAQEGAVAHQILPTKKINCPNK